MVLILEKNYPFPNFGILIISRVYIELLMNPVPITSSQIDFFYDVSCARTMSNILWG